MSKQTLKTNTPEAGIAFCKAYFTVHFSWDHPFHTSCVAVTDQGCTWMAALGPGPVPTGCVHIQFHPTLYQHRGCGVTAQFLLQNWWQGYDLRISLLILSVWNIFICICSFTRKWLLFYYQMWRFNVNISLHLFFFLFFFFVKYMQFLFYLFWIFCLAESISIYCCWIVIGLITSSEMSSGME